MDSNNNQDQLETFDSVLLEAVRMDGSVARNFFARLESRISTERKPLIVECPGLQVLTSDAVDELVRFAMLHMAICKRKLAFTKVPSRMRVMFDLLQINKIVSIEYTS